MVSYVKSVTGAINGALGVSSGEEVALLPPKFTAHPEDINTTEAAPATAVVSVDYAGTVVYYWQMSIDGTNWQSATALVGAVNNSEPTLTLLSTTSLESGYKIRCRINEPESVSYIYSDVADMTVARAVATATTPEAITLTEPAGHVFTSIVEHPTDATLFYLWEWDKDNTNSWVSAAGLSGASVVTNSTLVLDSTAVADTGRVRLRVRAYDDTATLESYSGPAGLTVLEDLALPVITLQPLSQYVTEPAPAQFVMAATHSDPLRYRWEASLDGVTWVLATNVYPNATGAYWTTLDIPVTDAAIPLHYMRGRVWVDGTTDYVYTNLVVFNTNAVQGADWVYRDAGIERVQVETMASRAYAAPFETTFDYYVVAENTEIVPIIGNTSDFYGGRTTGANWMMQIREEGNMRLIIMSAGGNVNVDTDTAVPVGEWLNVVAGWNGAQGYITVNGDTNTPVTTTYSPQSTHGYYQFFESPPVLKWEAELPEQTRCFTGTSRMMMVATSELINGLTTEYLWQCRNPGDTFWSTIDGANGLSDVDPSSINTNVLRLNSTVEADTRLVRCIARPYGATNSRLQIVTDGYLDVFEAAQPNYYVGHWVDMLRTFVPANFTTPHDMVSEPKVTGFNVRVEWASMEPTKGTYDFSRIADDIIPNIGDKKFMVFINDVSFKAEDWYMPQYLIDEGYAWYKRESNHSKGTAPLRHEPYVVDRYLRLVEQIANTFNDHPQFAGIAMQETANGYEAADREKWNYTAEKWRDAIIQMVTGIATYIHPHQTHMYLNFLDQGMSYMWDVNVATRPYNVLTGGPDILPGSYSLQTHVYPRTLDYKQILGGKTFMCAQYDSHRWSKVTLDHYNEPPNYGNDPPFFSPGDLMDYNEGNLEDFDGNGNTKREIQVDIIVWTWIPTKQYNNAGTVNDSYSTEDSLPLMASRSVVAAGDNHVLTGTALPTLPDRARPTELGLLNNVTIHEDIGGTDFQLEYLCDEETGFIAYDTGGDNHHGDINSETIHAINPVDPPGAQPATWSDIPSQPSTTTMLYLANYVNDGAGPRTYELVSTPYGFTIDAMTGVVSAVDGIGGTYTLQATLTDDTVTDLPSNPFSWEVPAVYKPPVWAAAVSENSHTGEGSYEFLTQYIGEGAPTFTFDSDLLLPDHEGTLITIPSNTAPVHGARQGGGGGGRQALVNAGWVITDGGLASFDAVWAAAASQNYHTGEGSHEFLEQYRGEGTTTFTFDSDILLPDHEGVYVTIPANTATVHGARQSGAGASRQALVNAGWVITDGGAA